MKRFLCLLILCLPLIMHAQEEKGIKWTTGLSWKQVKEKAKKESKYIFLDLYTTWCGPCKAMDKYVYTNDTVGNYFNDKFISVKVQMDRTINDDDFTKSWYNDSQEIAERYMIEGFPSFLFFSPNSALVNRELGYSEPGQLIAFAQTALTPGRMFDEPYVEIQKLIDVFKQKGEIDYGRIPDMVKITKKRGDSLLTRQLLQKYSEYMASLPIAKRYTTDNINFWSTLNLSSESQLLQLFYRDHQQIDGVMQKKGYALSQIDKCIYHFIVMPFIAQQLKNPEVIAGVTIISAETGTVVSNKTSYDEAEWKVLYKQIKKSFDKSYAKRNMLLARIVWYEKHCNWLAYAKTNFAKFKIAPPDLESQSESGNINRVGWNIFLYVNDSKLINEGIEWMAKLMNQWDKAIWMDTYANLLYKAGRKEDAIQWQEKAVTLAPARNDFKKALEQMKKGEPTYGVQPLVAYK
jgi:thioredoxin-related protein